MTLFASNFCRVRLFFSLTCLADMVQERWQSFGGAVIFIHLELYRLRSSCQDSNIAATSCSQSVPPAQTRSLRRRFEIDRNSFETNTNTNTNCERYEHEIDYGLWDIGSSKSL